MCTRPPSADPEKRPRLFAAHFSELVSPIIPAAKPDPRQQERATLAHALLSPTPALSEGERLAAQARHPSLFRAAALLGMLTDSRFRFLQTLEFLLATEVTLRLEKDPVRILDRLMGVYARSDQLEDEVARGSLLRALREALGRL